MLQISRRSLPSLDRDVFLMLKWEGTKNSPVQLGFEGEALSARFYTSERGGKSVINLARRRARRYAS